MTDKILAPLQPARTGPRFPVLPAEDHQQVMALLDAYGRLYDDDLMDDFMDLFEDDAVFHPNWPAMAFDKVVGRAALRPFFEGARAGAREQHVRPRHFMTNRIVTEADAASALVTASMLYVEHRDGHLPEVKMVGQYDYRLRKRDGRWSIAEWSMRYDK